MNDKLSKQAIGLGAAYGAQFLLGTAAALFFELPDSADESQVWAGAWQAWPTAAHMILGTLIVLGSVALLFTAWRAKNAAWKKAAVGNIVGAVISGGSGERFISTNSDWWTLLMSVGLLISVASLVWGLYKSKNV
jgi:membrane protein YdbS with pleckstrin-like domain